MRLFGRELTLDEIIGFVECNANPDDDLIHRAALELIAALRESQRRERAAVEALNKISDYNGSLICRCNEILKIANEWRGPAAGEGVTENGG